MRIPKQQALDQVTDRLSTILDTPCDRQSVGCAIAPDGGPLHLDALATAGQHSFAVEWKGSGSLGQVALAVDQVKRAASLLPGSPIPLVAVPYMGEVGRSYCQRAGGIAWLDLSGNARIIVPGLHVWITGHANRFRRPGRPESAFAPRGSRIARWLLQHPSVPVRQRTLASVTGLDEGYVSRVVGKLRGDELVVRSNEGITVRDADQLLDAWHEAYRFDRHMLIQGHIATVSGNDLVRQVAHTLTESDTVYAMTGLAAAWLWTQYAGFRLTTVYLRQSPTPALTEALRFREESRGANLWLVVPNDAGVFHGASPVQGIHCVHPVQAYLDLQAHPERAREAAEALRSRLLIWDSHDR